MSAIRTREDQLFADVAHWEAEIAYHERIAAMKAERAAQFEAAGDMRRAERDRDSIQFIREYEIPFAQKRMNQCNRELGSVILRAMGSCYRPSHAPM